MLTKSVGINCFEVERDFVIPNDLHLSKRMIISAQLHQMVYVNTLTEVGFHVVVQ